jgi:putative membrane protein
MYINIVPALSVVLGLLLAFRANTSYARYYEGRQLWQDLSSNTRNLARLIWCSIPERTQNDHLEKMRCMKLLLAFAVSTKHYLRRELGIDYYDLDYLLPPNWVPAAADDDNQDTDSSVTLDHHQQQQQQQQATSSSASSSASIKDNSKSNLLDTSSGDHPDDLGHNKNQDANSVNNQKGKTTYNTFKFVSDEDLPDEGAADMSLPLEIIFRMSLYMEQAKKSGKIDGTFSNVIITHLNNLNDCLAGMERIVNTPIPAVYVVHL